jgi:hypothetical protein
MSESTPITFSRVGFVRRIMTVRVYIGLVPMSPNTKPRDFMVPFDGDILSGILGKDQVGIAGSLAFA